MSNSRLNKSGKSEITGSTIGFRFHTNDEELEEVQLKQDSPSDKDSNAKESFKAKVIKITPGIQNKSEEESETVQDALQDQWNLLGKKSTSSDSVYESTFSNPIETWKKLNVLKEKITKTVEEKISEIKSDRNSLGKSSRRKLTLSKENSSISDSEDTSESSKISEQLMDSENQVGSPNKSLNENSNLSSTIIDTNANESVKKETTKKENESELRNRKSFHNFSDLIQLPDIKIATAKKETDRSTMDESMIGEVESGVEAEEHFERSEAESVDLFDDGLLRSGGEDSRTPSEGSLLPIYNVFHPTLTSSTYAIALLLGFILFFFFPLTDFTRGFIFSLILVKFWSIIKGYWHPENTSTVPQRSFVVPDYKSMPPLRVPHFTPVKGVWINEYDSDLYDPEYYSVTKTVPAYLELDDNILKLSRPKGRIRKRATYDEPEYKLQFISQRVYNISGCNVYLMPDGLTRKRLFSKKYPIVIFLKPDSLISEKKNGKMEEKESHENNEDVEVGHSFSESYKYKTSLCLFARCDRQKQEWYRKLVIASRVPSEYQKKKFSLGMPIAENVEDNESSTPFENLLYEEDLYLFEDYLRYMSKIIDFNKNSQDSLDGSEEKKSDEGPYSTGHLQWFNAFVNRILFDVFRSPYWLSKIHEKLRKKLNSIRLPYYIEEFEVIEMDLGKTGPLFHRVSPPYLDERGLWFDMDVTFDGLIRLTIQTHLNLIKLQKGIEENDSIDNTEKVKNENPSDTCTRKSKPLAKSVSKSSPGELKEYQHSPESHDLECKSWEDCTSELINEIKQFAEIAVEEGFLADKKKSKVETSSRSDRPRKSRSPIYDSDLEDSAESSDDDDEDDEDDDRSFTPPPPPPPPSSSIAMAPNTVSTATGTGSIFSARNNRPSESEEKATTSTTKRYPKDRRSSKGIFKVFENVAKSKYFKSMAQSKYIQKAIAGVSAARLRLTLELKSCTGILTINVPPPPSDRFWYGFREMPTIVFSANPKIGEKTVGFAHIKNYLQKKILHELKKVMVTPNMIDFVLPTSDSNRDPNFLQFDEPDLEEATPSE